MKVPQTASNRHFRSALRAGVGYGDGTALSCFIFDPMCHLCFSGEPTYETGYGTRQIRLICEWDLGLTCLADPHRLEKILPSPTSHKNGPTGAGMERGVVSLLRLQKPHTGPYRRSCRGPIREEICLQQKNRRRQHFSLTAPAILYGILPVYTFIPAFSASRTRRHLCRLPAGWLPRQSMAGCCRQIPES